MTRLIRWIRRLVAAVMALVALLAGNHAPSVPAPSSPAPAPTQAAPATPPAVPAGLVPTGPTPHCTYSMAVKADGTKRWIVVCVVYGQSTTLPGDWPTAAVARQQLFAFQQAWRDAVRAGSA